MQRSELRLSPALAAGPMLHALADNWWLILLKGICAIVFGLLALAWPGVTVMTLVLLYGAFALVEGVLALAAAIKGDTPAPRWWLAAVGLIGIIAGALTFLWPGITALVLLFLIAAWAIATGIMEIIGAIRLRKEIDDEWLLIAAGALSVHLRHGAGRAASGRRRGARDRHRGLCHSVRNSALLVRVPSASA